MVLTVEQRDRLLSLLPRYEPKSTGRKRCSRTQVFQGILWVLEMGVRWQDLNKCQFGVSYQTCHRYFYEWVRQGSWQDAWETLLPEMEEEDRDRVQERFIKASSSPFLIPSFHSSETIH